MNKFKKIFTLFLFFTVFYILFKHNYILNKSVIDGVNLWLTKVFPSLFIMFILNNLIINLDILSPLSKLLSPSFNKLFKTKGKSVNAFLLSIISGTPTSIFIIKEMLKNKQITSNDANKLIGFTFFSNPLFLYKILSLSFNKFITIKIILIHHLTNILIGLILRNKIYNNDEIVLIKDSINNKNILSLLPETIKSSLNTMTMILGTIIFYMIITNLFLSFTNINNTMEVIIKGLLEITQSLNMLPSLQIKSIIKEIIAISIISFGGLSIHTQVLSLMNNTNLEYKNFFYSRILHILISANTYLLIYFCIPS